MIDRTYYEVLGLTPDADGTTVNRTYWLLARKYQSDASNDPRAHYLLDELNEAYAVLGTPSLRTVYDATVPAAPQPPAPPTPRTSQPRLKGSGNPLRAGLRAMLSLRSAAPRIQHKTPHAVPDAATAFESPAQPGTAPDAPAFDDAAFAALTRRRGVPVDELRLSTASMVGRWRTAVGAAAAATEDDARSNGAPDSTLVDIFRSEEELDSPAEPLSAALEVLRGSRRPA